MEATAVIPEVAPLTEELFDEIVSKWLVSPVTEQTLSEFRASYPDIRFILCSEDDMGEREAIKSVGGFDFYLMAGGFGCACLTDAFEKAVGLVIATIEE